MRKLLLLVLAFAFLVQAQEYSGSSAQVEVGLAVKAAVIPPRFSNAEQLSTASINSYLRNSFNLDRFAEDANNKDRLKARLRTRMALLKPGQLCRGVANVLDACYTANSICEQFLQEDGCSLSESDKLSRCIGRWRTQEEENNANLEALKAAVQARCRDSPDKEAYVQACLNGEPFRDGIALPAGFPGLEEALISRGCNFRNNRGYAECVSDENEEVAPILVDGTVDEPIFSEELPPEMIIDESAVEEPLVEEQAEPTNEETTATNQSVPTDSDSSTSQSTCPTLVTSCSSGYTLRESVDKITNCPVNQCIAVTAPQESCFDSDKGKDSALQGTTSAVDSVGTKTAKTDSCASDTSLTEYFCEGTKLSYETIYCSAGCTNNACALAATATTVGTVKTAPISTSVKAPIAPITVKIVAVPSVLNDPSIETPEALLDSSRCTEAAFEAQCNSRLLAKVLGSFSTQFITQECQREIGANKELVQKFCANPSNAYNECVEHTQEACSVAQSAAINCAELTQNEDALIDLLAEAVIAKAQGGNTFDTELAALSNKLPPATAVVVDGVGAEFQKAEATVQKVTKPKDAFYGLQHAIGLKAEQEKQEARLIRTAADDVNAQLQSLETLKEALPADDKQLVDKVIEKVRPKRDAYLTAAQAKEKNAAGIFSTLGN